MGLKCRAFIGPTEPDAPNKVKGPQKWPILLMDEILHHLGALNYCNS